ncbi:MAG: PEPxxWA-CTERM sorting domain-containing protein [Alphaproteobacteria bacterium]|nr:PEPxxWA-CTERM sorting domain-containing protein [Alphaproteobacteria bacterium]MBU1513198.1 PEPxxWA-CTERM sorting domain-containing protein [Alphaproteobacteria bacterium]MBU2095306.1 PEPxxWA-CTERM sorting domain-containing protein [Alphaproteobacteria bacterium]MBU2152221.1 PEPxxWA-CTERM sorting domain-containing protein [Alphaproteobacteria bacterium]MBU2306732.1 PEPxxWA-CTERM sorting domain-containing protein [Alphaproteobacteria bacterium]
MVRDPGNGGGNPCHTNLPLACGGDPSAPVPEPAAWALMLAGFGLAGATLRQRRRAMRLQHI